MATKSTKAAVTTTPNEVTPDEIDRHYTFRKVAKFRKVSYEQFKTDMIACGFSLPVNVMHEAYDAIKIPVRATKGSAGYDFFAPSPLP